MARKNEREEEATPQPPIKYGEVTADNPSGIEGVSEEHAHHLGTLRGHGGPGAAGATVAGAAVHHATAGGTKPLPDRTTGEDVDISAGKKPGKNQPTAQANALKSGDPENKGETTETPEGSEAPEPTMV